MSKPIFYFSAGLLLTFIFTRIYLFIFPHSNLNLGPYNVHHAYVGGILLILCVIYMLWKRITKLASLLAGVGSAQFLDQLVFLIATDGQDLTYPQGRSLLGGMIMVLLLFLGIALLSTPRKHLPEHLRLLGVLVVLHFILDLIFVAVYPPVNPLRAVMIGGSALLIILLLRMNWVWSVPVFVSALLGAVLVQVGFLVSKSLLSGLVHVLVLLTAYVVLWVLLPGKWRK